MKFIRTEGDRLLFELGKRESRMFLELLKLYPAIPQNYQKLTRESRLESAANQRLLDEALAEQRERNRKDLLALLHESSRLKETGNGHQLSLEPAEINWLLEILNDIRVGSWIHIGSPNPKSSAPVEVTETSARWLWALEVSGYFQATLLAATDAPSP